MVAMLANISGCFLLLNKWMVMTNFFKCLELDYQDVQNHPDAFARLRADSLQAILVHQVYSSEVLANAIENLGTNQPGFLKSYFPDAFKSWFYGRNLNLASPDLDAYFDEAEIFNDQLERFLLAEQSMTSRLTTLLSQLDNGRPFVTAPGMNPGQRYMFMTFRCHEQQGYITAHSDNEFMLRPSYRHLFTLCEPDIFSFVLSLSAADEGGQTEIFNFKTPALSQQILSDDSVKEKPDITALEKTSIKIPAGGMLIFNSGAYLHRLSPVSGLQRRWTACSFMARSKDATAMYCWG
jgi:hypothetical protein